MYEMERETGFEPATLALARRCSTTELFPLTTKTGGAIVLTRLQPVNDDLATTWIFHNNFLLFFVLVRCSVITHTTFLVTDWELPLNRVTTRNSPNRLIY